MSDAHALLSAAWEDGDLTPLLILADLLDERVDHSTGDLIRLTTEEATTARPSPIRTRRLKQFRDDAWKSVRETFWPGMAVQGDSGAASFSRRPDPDRPRREHIVVRPDRRKIHWLLADVDGGDEVIATREGRELLRRPLPPATLAFLRDRRDV